MADLEVRRADEAVRAAVAALAEHQRLAAQRLRLAADVTAETARVQQLGVELARERNDVEQLTRGVLGFLYSLIGDERLSIEQREAVEAEARLGEAIASRDHLVQQLALVDSRLATQSELQLAATVRTARAAKADALVRTHDPAAMQLQDLAVRMEAIDIELVPLEDAVSAGEAALGKLTAIVTALERAQTQELEQSDARGLAGAAQASITLFQRAIDGLGTGDDDTEVFGTLVRAEDREPFVDAWIRALVSKGDRTARLYAAHAAMVSRRDRVSTQLAVVRARHDELARRKRILAVERESLITST